MKEVKSIKVSKKVWKKLWKLRMDLDCKSLDELIEKILKIIPTSKLSK